MDDIFNVFNEFIVEFELYNDMVKVKLVLLLMLLKLVKKIFFLILLKLFKQKQEFQVEVNEDWESVLNLLKKFKDFLLILCGYL